MSKKQSAGTRYERYNFNPTGTPSKKRFHAWPWVLGFVIVVIAVVLGIDYFINSSSQTNKANFSQTVSTSSKISKTSPKENTQTSNSKNINNSKETNQAAASNPMFAAPRTFDSVQDAKNYAKATQSSWIKDGYTTYTITSDGQGFITLKFIK